MIVGIATDCRPWNSIAARTASWNLGVAMSVTGIIPGSPYNTQSDGDDYAMCVSGRLSVPPLHCVVDVRDTPEKYQFILLRRIPRSLLRGASFRRVCPSSVVNQSGSYGNSSCGEREVDACLGENECEQAAADRDYEKRRARRNNPVNEQSAVK